MEIKGKIIAKPVSVSGVSSRGPWKKASLVIRYEEGQYPKDILLTNMNKAEEFEKLQIGQSGTFKFDGSVRQASNGNYYLDLNCWSWTMDQPAAPAPTAAVGDDEEPF